MRLRPLPGDSLGALGLQARLLWPSLRQRVCESSTLSAWSFPFGGLTPISHLFLSWRPCRSRSLIPSIAPSWWWPCPLLRWALLTLSGYVLSVPFAFSLRQSRWLIPSHCRPSRTVSLLTVSVIGGRFALAEGASPLALGSVGALGDLRWLHLYRLTPDLVSLRQFAVCRWSSGRCFILLLRDVPHVFMAIILSVSLTYACPWLVIPIG